MKHRIAAVITGWILAIAAVAVILAAQGWMADSEHAELINIWSRT